MEITNRYLANEAIDNFIIPDNDCWTHKFIKDTDCPMCSWGKRTIYSPVLPPIIDTTADAVIRGKNMHEAGHGRLTRCDKDASWTPLMGNVANALEDLRIEKGISKLSPAIAEDIRTMNKAIVPDVMRQFCDAQPGQVKPLDEALFALQAMEGGFTPTWRVSEIAQKYIDAAKEAFGKWRDCDCDTTAGYEQIIKVADEVIKCFEQAKKEMQQEQQGQQGQQTQQNQESIQESEGQGGSESSESEERSNSQNNSVASSDNGKGEKSGKNEDGAENAQESDEDNAGNDNANGNENNDIGNDNAQESEDGANDDNGENAESNESENAGDEGNEGENGESNEGNEGDKNNASKSITESKSSNGDRQVEQPQNANGIEDDFSGRDYKEDAIRKVIKNACDESVQEFGNYTAYTREDEIKPANEDEASYAKSKAKAAGMVSKLRSHLEESLKAMNRCKVIGNRDCGDLDASMLPYLAKSLTRNVFCETIKGISLDTTVSILIDESGSIGNTCEIFKTMAIAFSEALERIGIKYEILGHTTGYNHGQGDNYDRQVPMIIFEHKRFNQPLRKERNRLGSIGSYGCNVDGEALLHTWKRAIAQRAKRHIVFVLSDGLPNGGSHNDKLYSHLKKTVEYIRKNGGEVYAIGIGTMQPKKYYGEKNFFYAEGGTSINTIFFKRIAEAIAKEGRK